MSVYCVQLQHRFDAQSERLVPKYDVSPAADYGDVQYLLSPTAAPFRPEGVIPELHEKLKDFDDQDFLLLIGNPVLIGLAVAIAASYNNGDVNMLQWSGREQRYISIRAKGVFPDFEEEFSNL